MLLFFKNGKVVDQIIGAVPKNMIQSKFEQHAAPQSARAG
jgi:thioredoxin-like negative regulator of GroEL